MLKTGILYFAVQITMFVAAFVGAIAIADACGFPSGGPGACISCSTFPSSDCGITSTTCRYDECGTLGCGAGTSTPNFCIDPDYGCAPEFTGCNCAGTCGYI